MTNILFSSISFRNQANAPGCGYSLLVAHFRCLNASSHFELTIESTALIRHFSPANKNTLFVSKTTARCIWALNVLAGTTHTVYKEVLYNPLTGPPGVFFAFNGFVDLLGGGLQYPAMFTQRRFLHTGNINYTLVESARTNNCVCDGGESLQSCAGDEKRTWIAKSWLDCANAHKFWPEDMATGINVEGSNYWNHFGGMGPNAISKDGKLRIPAIRVIAQTESTNRKKEIRIHTTKHMLAHVVSWWQMA